jgi:hypothetical protein
VVDAVVEAEAGDDVASTVRVDVVVNIVVSSEAAGRVGVGDDVASTVRVDVVVNVVVSSEAACRVGVGDDVASTVRVDVVVDIVVSSEAEAKGEPANDAGADGVELPELTYSHQCAVTQEHRIHSKLLCGQHSSLKND